MVCGETGHGVNCASEPLEGAKPLLPCLNCASKYHSYRAFICICIFFEFFYSLFVVFCTLALTFMFAVSWPAFIVLNFLCRKVLYLKYKLCIEVTLPASTTCTVPCVCVIVYFFLFLSSSFCACRLATRMPCQLGHI